MLHDYIPNAGDERAAYAGARTLIERLQAAVEAVQADTRASQERERRRQHALEDLRGRLAHLALRVQAGGNIPALAAEAANVRRELEALCAGGGTAATDAPAKVPPAAEATPVEDKEALKNQLFEIMHGWQQEREDLLQKKTEKHLLPEKLKQVDDKWNKPLTDLLRRL
jgi:hypothetical protein